MFALGVIFLLETNRINTPIQVIAKSYLLRPVELRHAPSMGSSLVDQVAAGTKVNLTGYQSGEEGQRWVALDWKNAVAYAPADDLAAPKALDTEEGAKLLKFYLSGMETAEEVDDAVKSVNYYVKAFPGDIHSEEIGGCSRNVSGIYRSTVAQRMPLSGTWRNSSMSSLRNQKEVTQRRRTMRRQSIPLYLLRVALGRTPRRISRSAR